MKAEELRIGNWVKDENGPYQIKGEHLDEDNFPTIQTWEIPLTEEWLMKFGFTWKNFAFRDGTFTVRLHKEFYVFLSIEGVRPVQIKLDYVHQLQNLYFALTGKELTIKT